MLPRLTGSCQSDCRRWVTFAFKPSAQASITFMEFDEAGQKVAECSMLLPDTMVTLVHDMAVTEHYYVIVAAPVNFQPSKFLGEYVRSKCSVAECLVYDPTGRTRVSLGVISCSVICCTFIMFVYDDSACYSTCCYGRLQCSMGVNYSDISNSCSSTPDLSGAQERQPPQKQQ